MAEEDVPPVDPARPTALRFAGGRWCPVPPPYGPALAAADRAGLLWLLLPGPDDPAMAEVEQHLGLHESDAPGADPLAFSVGTVRRDGGALRTGRVTVMIGPHVVVTVQHGAGGDAAAAARALAAHRHAQVDRWTVVHAVVQHAVAGYAAALEAVAEEMNALEEQVFSSQPDGRAIGRIHRLKRELVELRRAIVPVQRPLGALIEADEPGPPGRARRHLRLTRELAVQAAEQVTGYDDLLNSILQARLAQVSIEQNNDMRKIAAWAAIAAVQTVIAGIYGMNFRHMPELGWSLGYPGALGLMLGAGALLYWRLRRAGWL
ncbi:magnesium transport protein CorA [Pilimelia anulata]|uniref:Magnesium transport protein CorA n=1 Tax=Pilimelia anulata TaxID=53371 RepID=A0A8J3BHC7_9ACTN|nr:CorA family divalent cation transporter [Pilimelia anulata]GGK11183.1 magnesium transport protein CorA [Pilimelia anulata]